MLVGVQLKVECHAGYRGEETPRFLILGEKRLRVEEVIDRWQAPDHRTFKLLCSDGAIYMVRQDVETQAWELTMMEDITA